MIVVQKHYYFVEDETKDVIANLPKKDPGYHRIAIIGDSMSTGIAAWPKIMYETMNT